jgi:hypothetical protein
MSRGHERQERKLTFEELVDELLICRYCADNLSFRKYCAYAARSGASRSREIMMFRV